MHIVAVTRCKDEQDIIEAFVRHTLKFADSMIVLNNGSVDNTLQILQNLHNEGLPLYLFEHVDEVLAQDLHANCMFEMAIENFAADWVLFLDVDEFIHVRTAGLDFRDWLNATPDNLSGINILLENYHPLPDQMGSSPLNVVERITHRWPFMPPIPKVFYRHSGGPRPVISAGHHYLTGPQGGLSCRNQADVVLAHFNARNPWQLARKATLGWLRMEASGTNAKNTGISGSYRDMFALLKDNPEVFMAQVIDHRNDLVFDPLPYVGGPLRYTTAVDEAFLYVKAVCDFALRVASRQGQRIDDDPSLLQSLRVDAVEIHPVL